MIIVLPINIKLKLEKSLRVFRSLQKLVDITPQREAMSNQISNTKFPWTILSATSSQLFHRILRAQINPENKVD